MADAQAEKEKAAREQEQYQASISSGDKAFKQQDYDLAIKSYQEALSVRANDEYATKQLAEIESLKAEAAKKQQALSAQQEIDEKYAAAIKSADEAINKKQLAEAIAAYKDALAVKPNETYPKNQIDKLEKQLADDEQNQEFAGIIKEADASFDDSDYEAAKSKYNQALAIKPNDNMLRSGYQILTLQL